MAAIVKTDLRVLNADTFKYVLSTKPTYAFISGTDPWDDEQNPPIPLDSTQEEYMALETLVGLKKVLPNDVISVVPRTNWIQGTTYDQYDDRVDLVSSRNPQTDDFWRFYVVTEDFNVYKCISNNYSSPSVNRPTGSSSAPFQTPDGYIWKYMYTIQASDAFRFMTVNWMPCYTLDSDDGSAAWNSQQSAIPGTVDNIIVTDKGANYSFASPPSITISGDGVGATASPVVNQLTGELDDIIINTNGSNYTYANVTITDSGSGVGAQARAVIGPRRGHGADPKVELGATYLMVKVTIDGDEGGVIPTNIEYRVSGLLEMPGDIANNGYTIKLSQGDSRLFTAGETITGQTSGAIANIVQIDYTTDTLHINNLAGSIAQNEQITSQSYNSATVETIFNGYLPLVSVVYNESSVDKRQGKILFIANRDKITRVPQQKEDIVAVLSF